MKNLSNDEVSTLCRELAYLLHAGMGNADALTLMAEDGGKHTALLKNMAQAADEGAPLSETFRQVEVFPAYASRLLKVGDSAGRTEETLNALADYYEGRERLSRHLRTSLLYPIILLLIMLAVIVVLLVYVLPIFDELFDHSPVYRIGGDEFLVLLLGQDYENRASIMQVLHEKSVASIGTAEPVISAGMSVYSPGEAADMHAIFEQADANMYKEKQMLRQMGAVMRV